MHIPFFRRKEFFTEAEKQQIVRAIQEAERCTSGEIRVYVESRCRFVDPLDRAGEIFWGLKMEQTEGRNGVLLYIALKDHQLAVLGDQGIHEKVGSAFWNEQVQLILTHFNKANYAEGIAEVVKKIGEALYQNFPFEKGDDKNELSDNIVFGK